MAFLAPLAIKAGATIGSSLLASKLSKSKPTPMERGALSGDIETQKTAQGAGKNLIGMGQNALTPAMGYWSSLLAGNRNQAASALAPDLMRIGQGYDQTAKTSAALMPRGGPSAEFNSQLPWQRQRDTQSLFQQMRPQAAGQMGSLGMNLLSQGSGMLQTASSAGRNILNQQQNQKQMEADRGRSMGAGLFDIIQRYGFPLIDKAMNRGVLSGSAPTGTNPDDYGPWLGS